MNTYALWSRSLAPQGDALDDQRGRLAHAYVKFRERTAHLVAEISTVLPGLTVHDITHLDALWRVADMIAGPEYPINPAEAFVLGGAILLHDAGHAIAAYPDRRKGLKATVEWRDAVARLLDGNEPDEGSPEERNVLFHVLRSLHAHTAVDLAMNVQWTVPGTKDGLWLLEDTELRFHYGSLIGTLAASHHWDPVKVSAEFSRRRLGPPAFLAPAEWSVDALKIAFLLRVADAAHVDAARAPWFLFALRQPSEFSDSHWRFQAKLAQPTCTDNDELAFSAGAPFLAHEQRAWWLSYETACMVDRELKHARALLRENGRQPFRVTAVECAESPELFATNVATLGWEPVDVAITARNPAALAKRMGGKSLYGDRPEKAVRELLQNSFDAVRALRALEGSRPSEEVVSVAVELIDDCSAWLHVEDTGIGMSRFVLTHVLLDFGGSLWRSEAIGTELPGLAASGFRPIGQFGIGFFAIFMLGSCVKVTTRSFLRAEGDASDQWILEFPAGMSQRPILRKPKPDERLRHSGTRISVTLDRATLSRLVSVRDELTDFDKLLRDMRKSFPGLSDIQLMPPATPSFSEQLRVGIIKLASGLCPSSDITVRAGIKPDLAEAVCANDWKGLSDSALLTRVGQERHSRRRLYPIQDGSGQLLGRAAYTGDWYWPGEGAALTYQGLIVSRMPFLAGLIVGENNPDVSRHQSRPAISPALWKEWATTVLANESESLPVDSLAALHSLVPDIDLPVYVRGSMRYTESEIRAWIRKKSEIHVHAGRLTREDYDDVSEDRFDTHFAPNDDVLCFPQPTSRETEAFGEVFGIVVISYNDRIKEMLREEWETFEEWEETDFCVGRVLKYKVARSIVAYARKTDMEYSAG